VDHRDHPGGRDRSVRVLADAMMNIPAEVAGKAVDALRSTPVILGLLVLNIIMLVGFWYTLSSIANAMERRDAMIKACIERGV
jgi:hypothetical protein